MKAAFAALACGLMLGAGLSANAYDRRLDAEAPLEVVELSSAPAVVEEPAVLRIDAQGPMMFDGPVGGAMDRALKPAYRVAEAASDHIYEALRSYFVKPLFPARLTRGLDHSPDTDSYEVYKQKLRVKEARYAERLRESYPVLAPGEGGGSAQDERMQAWRSSALEEQQSVLVSAFGDALMTRYNLDRFGQFSQGYASDRRNWDPGFFAMAAIVGGAFAYAGGVHAVAPAGPMRVYVDLRPLYRIQRNMAAGDPRARVGDLELGYKRFPVRLTSTWGVLNGHLADELVGLKCDLRF